MDDGRATGSLWRENTQEELETAFDAVASPIHWKNEIDCEISNDAMDAVGGWELVYRGVIHFTGTVPTRELGLNDVWRVRAIGYAAGPCGDH